MKLNGVRCATADECVSFRGRSANDARALGRSQHVVTQKLGPVGVGAICVIHSAHASGHRGVSQQHGEIIDRCCGAVTPVVGMLHRR